LKTSLFLALPLALSIQTPDWLGAFLDGSRALENGDAAAAKTALERALADLPEHAATAWQLASACARLDERDAAFAWLEHCIAWGGGEVALLEWDPDLASLRKDPRFAKLVEGLRARAADARPQLVGELAVFAGGAMVSVGPEARAVATGRGLSTLLYDRVSNEIVAALDRPGERGSCVCISPDGRVVVTGGEAENKEQTPFLRVFDAASGDPVATLADVGWEPRVQFSADGRRLLAVGSARPNKAAIWDTSNWSERKELPSGVEQLVLSPDGTRALLLRRDGSAGAGIIVWDVDAAKAVREHDKWAFPNTQPQFSPDSALIAFCESRTGRVRVLDARDGSLVNTIDSPTSALPVEGPAVDKSAMPRAYFGVCFLGTSGELALTDRALNVEVRDARSGELRRTMQIPGEPVWRTLSCTADGRLLLAASFHSPTAVLDVKSGQVLWTSDEPGGFADGFGTDESCIVNMSWVRAPLIRDVYTGKTTYTLESPACRSISIADPRRDEIWVGAEDGSVRCIDAASARMVRSWKHGDAPVAEMAVSSDVKLVATLDDARTLRVADAASGELRAVVVAAAEHTWAPFLSFSPDGSALALPQSESEIAIFAAPTWTRRCTMRTEKRRWCFAWSPDSATFAAGVEGGSALLFDAQDGRQRGAALKIDGEVETLAFEPDGTKLWVGSNQSKVHIFGVADRAIGRVLDLADLDNLDGVALGTIRFSRDGKVATTASSGWGVVAAWDTTDGRRLWNFEYSGGNESALQSAFDSSGDRLFVWGQGPWSPRVVDARNGKTLLDLAGRFGNLLPLPGSTRLAAIGSEGLEVVDLHDGRRLWTRSETPDGGWLVSTAARFVDGTRASLERIPFVTGNGSLPLDALAALLLDPKKVRAAAAGIVIAPAHVPAIPTLTAREPYRRVVHIEKDKTEREITFDASSGDGVRAFEVILDGHRTVVDGIEGENKQRSLTLHCAPPAGGSTEVRVRSISKHGILSRALRVTVERE
jgi:WD40 repeat protein